MALVQFRPTCSVLFACLRARSFSLFDTGARAPPHASYDSMELEISRLIVQFRPLALSVLFLAHPAARSVLFAPHAHQMV
jgi:hypothetical protein